MGALLGISSTIEFVNDLGMLLILCINIDIFCNNARDCQYLSL